MENLKNFVRFITSPIRFFFATSNRSLLKSIYSKDKTLKHDVKSDFRTKILMGLHQTLVGSHPETFAIHNNEINFSSTGGLMSVQAHYVGEVEYHQMNYLIKNHLKKDMVFLDVGGHHGAFATIVAHELKKQNLSGKVFTFEPDVRNIAFIEKNILQNNLTEVIQIVKKAVSDQNGKGKFILHPDNSCNWLEIGVETASELESTEVVEMVSIDNFCKNFERVDVIKIDIQGGEFKALVGAEKVLDKFKPVLFVEIMDYSVDAKKAKAFLEKKGYSLNYLTKDSRLVKAGNPEIFVSWDVVAIYS